MITKTWLILPGPFLLPNLQEEKCIQMMSNVGINHHSDSQPVSNGLRDADCFRIFETPAPRMGL